MVNIQCTRKDSESVPFIDKPESHPLKKYDCLECLPIW